jgi:hypothetical protein
MEENKTKQMFKIFNFGSTYEAPENKPNEKLNIVSWGSDNLYPKYILDRYNAKGSSTHKSIINKKIKFISGRAFEDIVDPRLADFVKKNKLVKEVKKATTDYELFNAFAFEVIWNNAGTDFTSIQHIPVSKLRIGIKDEKLNFDHLWFSNDWEKYKKEGYEPEMIRTFNPLIKQGKQIMLYIEYNPEAEYYPIPGYATGAGMNAIEMDYEIGVFHLSQVKNGYAPSFVLNFATGIPTEEEMDEFNREFKRNYQGASNSGKIIITYSEGADGKPELIPIQLSDSDERFSLIKDMVKEEIVTAHEIPAPMALLTPGQLASTQERDELMAEFQKSYVTPRQENIETVLFDILSSAGYTEELKLKEYVDSEVTSTSNTYDEIRSSVGGITALMQLQQSVASGITSRSSALGVLELIYGFNPEQANKILGDVTEGSVSPEVQAQLDDIKKKL